MIKMDNCQKKSVISGSKLLGMNNSQLFGIGMGINLLSSAIGGTLDMIATKIYENNPNPANRLNNYYSNKSTFRFSPNASKSTFGIIGGF